MLDAGSVAAARAGRAAAGAASGLLNVIGVLTVGAAYNDLIDELYQTVQVALGSIVFHHAGTLHDQTIGGLELGVQTGDLLLILLRLGDLTVDVHPQGVELADQILQHLIRANDVWGISEEGELYLILSQTDKESLPIVSGRLKKAGIITYETGIAQSARGGGEV